jgi:hypothetical protein
LLACVAANGGSPRKHQALPGAHASTARSPSFVKSAEQLQSGYTVSISTAQQDFKEIFAAQSSVKGYESVNGFHREPSSDECSIQRGSEVRETLKEEKVPLLETLPLVGYAEDDLRVGILCHSVSSPQDER